MPQLIYDIETVALSDERLALIEPEHEAPGNLKDPEKISAAKKEKAAAWKEKAALSPLTGRVAMTGSQREGAAPMIRHLAFKDADDESLDLQESLMIRLFWGDVREAVSEGAHIVSFNGHHFDLPFLIKRSWALKVAIPPALTNLLFNKYGAQMPFMDLMEKFCVGERNGYVSLETVAKFLGLPGKDGDCKLLRQQLEHEPEKAIAYLEQDLRLTKQIGQRMYLVD